MFEGKTNKQTKTSLDIALRYKKLQSFPQAKWWLINKEINKNYSKDLHIVLLLSTVFEYAFN